MAGLFFLFGVDVFARGDFFLGGYYLIPTTILYWGVSDVGSWAASESMP